MFGSALQVKQDLCRPHGVRVGRWRSVSAWWRGELSGSYHCAGDDTEEGHWSRRRFGKAGEDAAWQCRGKEAKTGDTSLVLGAG